MRSLTDNLLAKESYILELSDIYDIVIARATFGTQIGNSNKFASAFQVSETVTDNHLTRDFKEKCVTYSSMFEF